MTERGLPIVDGAPACPFVAFEDDRDERAASPDHRHRCYAEPQPAPRALAHQEAYCLSSAFPVCPTFQDWARREAARSRLDAPAPRAADAVAAAAMAPGAQRNPPRNWSAPPPWSGRDEPGGRSTDWDEQEGDAEEGASALPPQGRGLSGSYADRVASEPGALAEARDPEYGDDDDEDDEDAPVGDVPPYAPPIQRPQARSTLSAPARQDDSEPRSPDGEDEDGDEAAPGRQRRRRERDLERAAAMGGAAGAAGSRGGDGPRRERRRDAPEWERARPMEAYPTLRSRRLAQLSLPPLLVAVVALAIAAAVLFALPGLLGFGKPSAGESSTPTTPVVTQLITPAPTPVPAPTDQVYVVKSGDTLSRIAGRFGISLDELIAANAETLPDPNKLQIGDQLIIPARNPSQLPAATTIPGAT